MDQSLKHLLQFKTKDKLLQPRAFSLIGDIYCDQKKYLQAIKYYQKSIELYPDIDLNAQYIYKLALTYEAIKNYPLAIQNFKKIIKKFPSSIYYDEAKKHKYRLKTYIKNY